MLMLKALRTRALLLLWTGQALSAVGDEIYRVALIWLAVGLIGEDAGYLAAAQSGALFVLSLLGGHWADRWDHRKTLIRVDLLRAAIVLLPVAAFYAGGVSLPVLVVMAVAVSGLGAFFDPALQATLPDVSPDLETLQAATGLMGTTVRLARAVGPAFVGLLGPLLPMIHFFTLDSLSFGVSALSVSRLPPARTPPEKPAARRTLAQTLSADLRDIRRRPVLRDLMLVRMMVSSLWGISFSLGLALAVKALAPTDVRAFGWIVACYGAGNVIGALAVGNMRRERPLMIVFVGYVFLGAGFFAMGLCRGLAGLGAASLFAAIGGPINDIPFFDYVQREFPVRKLAGVVRMKMAVETGALLLLTSASPPVFRAYGAQAVLSFCGACILALGVAGLIARAERRPPAFTAL